MLDPLMLCLNDHSSNKAKILSSKSKRATTQEFLQSVLNQTIASCSQ